MKDTTTEKPSWSAHWRDNLPIIKQAFAKFPTEGGSVQWKAAFKAHPEWREKLLGTEGNETSFGTFVRQNFFPGTGHYVKGKGAVKTRRLMLDQAALEPSRVTKKRAYKPRKRRQPAPITNGTLEAMPAAEILTCPCCKAEFAILSRGQHSAAGRTLQNALSAAHRVINSALT